MVNVAIDTIVAVVDAPFNNDDVFETEPATYFQSDRLEVAFDGADELTP